MMRDTSPRLPLSRPVMTMTLSPFLILLISTPLQHFRRERDDLHEPLGAKLARHRPEDARADRVEVRVEQHGGVRIETDQRAVGAAHTLLGAHHHRVVDLTLL